MINANDLIAKFLYALENIWGYIWGQWGAMWTAAKQKQKVNYMVSKYGTGWKNNSEAKEDNYYRSAFDGGKWVGHHVADCSGLFRYAFDKLGKAIAHSSNRIWNSYCSKKGELNNGRRDDGRELLPGTAVFVHPAGKSNRTHIGLYVGGGKVIEASGTSVGVIESDITHRKWVEWGELKNVAYEGGDDPMPGKPTLRKGDQGEYVRQAQQALIDKGFDCGKWGADGKFGAATEDAVKRFQKAKGLTTDGVIGPATWDALEDEEPVTVLYAVTIPHLTEYQADALLERYPGSSKTKEMR